ncbi:MAG TPA: response regulator transcription factor [Gemmatimonadaceae bacterium]|nr:response regulator transcription factor [Gemmatimonadaceae bacterium]
MRLLLAEDDAQLGRTLTKGLRQEAYAVDIVADGENAIHHALINEYDVIILDVMMPRRDGFSVCRELRLSGSRTPVLMLTARDTVADKIAGLDAGGDDYLTKPFEFAELLARLRALLRRRTTDLLAAEVRIGSLRVNMATHTVDRGGRTIVLTAKEFAMLAFLARHEGHVVSRAEICAHVWDDNHDPYSNAIEVYINRLRRKIDSVMDAPLIHTRRGAGYMLAELKRHQPA